MNVNKAGAMLVEIAGVGFAAMLWFLVLGRAVNSPAAFRLSGVRIIGPAVSSLRAATNQVYDVAGED